MSEVAAAAERLRAAGSALRARERGDVVAALARVLDLWSDRSGPWQARLVPAVAASAGFTEPNVRDALARALANWTGAAFARAIDSEIGARPDARGEELTSIALAGAIPMPTLLHVACALAARTPALVKPASRDRATLPLVVESIAAVEPALARCVAIADFDPVHDVDAARAFFASPLVVASGSDETVAAVRARLGENQRLVAYGHRLSIAVLGPGALDAATARALAVDVCDWDQLGCLSPAAVFVVGCTSLAIEAFARSLGDALAERERSTPRGAVDAHVAAQIRAERGSARARFAASGAAGRGLLIESEGTRFTVVLEPDARLRAAPLHRFVRIHPVASTSGLAAALAPLARFLSTIAVAGLDPACERELTALGGNRTCSPGEMQSPPLAWRRDGLGLVEPLLRP